MKHNCAVALIASTTQKILQPKTLKLLELQKNRGQDAAGIISLSNEPNNFIHLTTTYQKPLIKNLKNQIYYKPANLTIGHLRYATYGNNETPQPTLLKHILKTKTIAIAGNFNITNLPEINLFLKKHNIFVPKNNDIEIILYLFAFFTDKFADKSSWNIEKWIHNIYNKISGGYFFVVTNANGQAALIRDPNGIRPAFFYNSNNTFIAASEKYAITQAFNINQKKIKEIPRGNVILLENYSYKKTITVLQKQATYCSLEKIYFSNQNDTEIYSKRKCLGKKLYEKLPKKYEKTILCYVPNSAKPAFDGLIDEIYNKTKKLPENLPIISKNKNIRTFISNKSERKNIIKNIYEVLNYDLTGRIIICVEDSIIRGNTLKNLIPKLLQLNPEKIIFLSSAPMFKYLDFYGIDIASLEELIAFKALMTNLREDFPELIPKLPEFIRKNKNINTLQQLYAMYSEKKLTQTIIKLLAPKSANKVEILYNSVEDIKNCLGKEHGDWYFTGNYPTKDGAYLINKAFLDFLQGKNTRVYEFGLY